MNKYLSLIIVLAVLSGAEVEAQTLRPAPRLVVNVAIDQLRTDYIEQFSSLYTTEGFKKLLQEGSIYEAASYPFAPIDRASAIAAIATGTTPHYNNIVGAEWLDRSTLRLVHSTDDDQYGTSPAKMATSTIGDELKVATKGAAIVCGVAAEKDASVLSAGHAADGAFWFGEKTSRWTTCSYYTKQAQNFVRLYNNNNAYANTNEAVSQFAQSCVSDLSMGKDDITDYLSVTLSAKVANTENGTAEMEVAYIKLDNILAKLVKNIEDQVGKDRVLFVLTGTGYTDEPVVDYAKYRIPTGTFYINRTANLLNMYLGAIYGQGKYVLTCYHNQIYLDRKLIEQRRISYNDIVARSKELLLQTAGVRGVEQSPYDSTVSGDLVLEISPGWQVINEDNQEQFTSRAAFVPFPIILYGTDIKAAHINTPATIDRIAPTIAKAIRIRAPNACSAAPLQ